MVKVRSKTFEELTRWERRWFNAAVENAQMSKDPSTKVGSVIVAPDGKRRISEGYNGLPTGIADFKWRLDDRTYKYPATLHAELNAILFSRCYLGYHAIYSSQPPCAACCAAIVQVGIKDVYWVEGSKGYMSRWKDDVKFGRVMLEEANIKMMEYMT